MVSINPSEKNYACQIGSCHRVGMTMEKYLKPPPCCVDNWLMFFVGRALCVICVYIQLCIYITGREFHIIICFSGKTELHPTDRGEVN